MYLLAMIIVMNICTIKTVLRLSKLKEIIGQFFLALRSCVASGCKQHRSSNPVTVTARRVCKPGLRAALTFPCGLRVPWRMLGISLCWRGGQT